MTTLMIEIPDEQMPLLIERAQARGLSPEDWVRLGIVERLASSPEEEERQQRIAVLTQQLLKDRAAVYRALAEGAP